MNEYSVAELEIIASFQKTIFVNGEYVPRERAQLSVFDRGLLFGDGIYEVVPVFADVPFLLDRHLTRMNRSLSELDIRIPDVNWRDVLHELRARNRGGTFLLYIQVNRGADLLRNHLMTSDLAPTYFAFLQAVRTPNRSSTRKVVRVGLREDPRWRYCRHKTVNLLPNSMLRTEAKRLGIDEIVFTRSNEVMEGTTSNVFFIRDRKVITPALNDGVLPGITRALVLELCSSLGLEPVERAIWVNEISSFDEVWLTSASRGIVPVSTVEGNSFNSSIPIWEMVHDLYMDRRER